VPTLRTVDYDHPRQHRASPHRQTILARSQNQKLLACEKFALASTSHEATAAVAKAVIPNGVARDFASRAERGRTTQ
jgi:hypothetical protein